MNWTLALRRNRDQLRTIVLALFALAGMRIGGSLFTLRRDVFAAIMAVLRPAESAVRRLIVIAAHGLVLKPQKARPQVMPGRLPEGPGSAMPGAICVTKAFKLFDPLKHFDAESVWGVNPSWESQIGPSDPALNDACINDAPVDATHLGQRLNALMHALGNLSQQARRLARRQEKRDSALKAARSTRLCPMRPGLPPGWRERRIHEIDGVLRECHGLANDLLNSQDTS